MDNYWVECDDCGHSQNELCSDIDIQTKYGIRCDQCGAWIWKPDPKWKLFLLKMELRFVLLWSWLRYSSA